jgi:5-methylcytosine-specific restriction endonuclease McrA
MFVCQYCNSNFSQKELTLDHVLPISRGGKTSWENIVSACNPCNSRKGSKLIKPNKLPYQPTYYELANNRKKIEFDIKHPSWANWLT